MEPNITLRDLEHLAGHVNKFHAYLFPFMPAVRSWVAISMRPRVDFKNLFQTQVSVI